MSNNSAFHYLQKYSKIVNETPENLYKDLNIDENITYNNTEILKYIIFNFKNRIEKNSNYSKFLARILNELIELECLQNDTVDFVDYLKFGIRADRISPELLSQFDLETIILAIKPDRTSQFELIGLQTLKDRYLLHDNNIIFESVQHFFMRVAMGIALGEQTNNIAVRTEHAINFYDILSQFYFMSSTPTLFNSGTLHSQMSSCYLSTVQDDLTSIFKMIGDNAQLSKWAGGLGNDWTNVRATGSKIKGTNGESQGLIPFLKVANDTLVAVNQGGKRKGAGCAYLETWHLDIEDFLELRKNTGDERRRAHDMNTANWIPDLFMERVKEDGEWTLFSPSDVTDLHDLYGIDFTTRYAYYESVAKTGKILHKTIQAKDLYRKMIAMIFETGHAWFTFKDPCNLRSPQSHVGVVHSSNLCTEITLNTSEQETAVCNLGSINLLKHLTLDTDTQKIRLDLELLEKTVRTAIRMLDNVISINFYPIPEAENSNMKHRPVGLGIMGFQDCLYAKGYSYASESAIKFADYSMEAISYYAINASSDLAKSKGKYDSFEGSLWSYGIMPIDSINILNESRTERTKMDISKSGDFDWDVLREKVKTQGMRNSNVMAIAPTATISNIVGVTQSIEPTYKNLFVKSNLSGDFLIPNKSMINTFKELGIWDDQMLDDLKYYDGSLAEIERIPQHVKDIYLTAFDIDSSWLIDCASRRQKWIDQAQSLNLYCATPSGQYMSKMYMYAWEMGLKTTYYLRCLGATQIEKSTIDINKRSMQPRWMKNKSASGDITQKKVAEELPTIAPQEVERSVVCKIPNISDDGDCEACQ